MADEQQVVDTTEEHEDVTPPAMADAIAGETDAQKIARLEANAAKFREFEHSYKNKTWIAKIKKENAELRKAAETAPVLQAELDGLKTKIKNGAIDSALEKALVEAKGNKTALKLIDRAAIKFNGDDIDADSVKAAVEALKKSDPILFEAEVKKDGVVQHPAVKRAVEGDVAGGYAAEMAGAKTTQQIEAVMRKYGVMTG